MLTEKEDWTFLKLKAELDALNTESFGMLFANLDRIDMKQRIIYGEDVFQRHAEKMRDIKNKIMEV